jgi:SAM-dependent methyltransferase
MKRLRPVRRLAWLLVGAVPDRLAHLALRGWAIGVGEREPRAALRTLFAAYDELYKRIDRVAIDYDEGVHPKHRLTRYHDFFVQRVRPGERVLDVGCGKGELAYDLAERAGARVTGIDLDRDYLAFARDRFAHPGVEFAEGDATRALPDGGFDVVVLSNVLEHIAERPALLRAIIERARPGRVLLRVPAENRDWSVPFRRELGLPHFSDPTHEIEYDVETLASELRQAGLEPVHVQVNWGEIWAEARPGAPVRS